VFEFASPIGSQTFKKIFFRQQGWSIDHLTRISPAAMKTGPNFGIGVAGMCNTHHAKPELFSTAVNNALRPDAAR